MKCEICHSAEAETAIVRTVKGKRQELYVCKACASKEKKARCRSHVAAQSEGGEPSVPGRKEPENQQKTPPMLGMILGAAFDILGHVIQDQQRPPLDPSCPKCGITRNEWRKRVRMGCSECYAAFAKELYPIILDDQGSLQHIGKSPRKYEAIATRIRLELQLKDAVAAQNFEKAIELRNALDSLPATCLNEEKKEDAEGGTAS